MADRGDVTTKQVEVEWEGVLWEVDVETEDGGPLIRLSLWRTKANGSREQVQAEDPPQDPLTQETVQGWLFASEVPDRLVHALTDRILQARAGK
jgi:hypothetical protein